MNAATKTELYWGYTPTDFFEQSISFAAQHGDLTFAEGKATLTLSTATDPVPAQLMTVAREHAEAFLAARCLQSGRSYSLGEWPTVHQHSQHGVSANIIGGSGALAIASASVAVDMTIRNKDGDVVSDSSRDRWKADADFLQSIAQKIPKSKVLSSLLRSYHRGIQDHANSLVHLFEINEILSKHFGGDAPAKKALDLKSWKTLGTLANDEPLQESRHRGKHFDRLRPATQTELEAARQASKQLIVIFANTIS